MTIAYQGGHLESGEVQQVAGVIGSLNLEDRPQRVLCEHGWHEAEIPCKATEGLGLESYI